MDASDENGPVWGADGFSQKEISFFDRFMSFVEHEIEPSDVKQNHRYLLGCASKLVDLAADNAALNSPGMRVVVLGILAERLEQLALNFDIPVVQNQDETS